MTALAPFNCYRWLLVLLALFAYSLPWVINPSISLSPGGYDLAEWSSLHPEVRANALTTSLLLRLQPALIALIVTLNAQRPFRTRAWWLKALFALLTAVALLPPLEFFTVAREDVNYRQQFTLAIVTLIAGAAGLSGRLSAYRWLVLIGVAFIGIVTSLIGLNQANLLMQQFRLPSQIGGGGALLVVVYAGLSLFAWTSKQTR